MLISFCHQLPGYHGVTLKETQSDLIDKQPVIEGHRQVEDPSDWGHALRNSDDFLALLWS